MNRLHATNDSVVVSDMDGAIIGESWHAAACEIRNERVVGERAGENSARIGEECLCLDRLRKTFDRERRLVRRLLHLLRHPVERGR